MSVITSLPRIGSTEELIALAHAMEQEAVRRYQELAQRMRSQGEAGLAATFAQLAQMEARHVEQVEARARELTGNPPDHALVTWELPDSFDADAARSATLSPYRALAIAVRNEERAFAFFSYLAAEAPNDALRALAEIFAKEELDHAARLRHERRRAWRSEHAATARHPPSRPGSVDELLAQAVPMERAAAAAHRALAAASREDNQAATAALFETAAADEDALASELAARLGATAASPAATLHARSVFEGLGLLEDAFDRYADAADHATDEAMLQEAQRLAAHALQRLATVHGALPRPA